jgi:hypothetical protein
MVVKFHVPMEKPDINSMDKFLSDSILKDERVSKIERSMGMLWVVSQKGLSQEIPVMYYTITLSIGLESAVSVARRIMDSNIIPSGKEWMITFSKEPPL